MSLIIQCDHCDEVLEQPGGLLFSAPDVTPTKDVPETPTLGTAIGLPVWKYHLCIKCTAEVIAWVIYDKPPR